MNCESACFFHVRVHVLELDNDTHESNVQVDVDISAAGCWAAGLDDKR